MFSHREQLKESIELWTVADLASDLALVLGDVEAVDESRAGRGRVLAGQDG